MQLLFQMLFYFVQVRSPVFRMSNYLWE